jgi:tetratricopeptide (TPR) repeat protein
MRLSPLDPFIHAMQTATALAHLYAGRYDEASVWAENASHRDPNYLPALRFAAASNALGGRIEKAREMLERLRQLEPNRRISNLREVEDFAPCIATVIEEGLRKAGMPE